MRKYAALLLAVFMIALSACPDHNGGGDSTEPSPDGKTRVAFVNGNDFSVTVYSDSSRLVKFTDVGANGESEAVETEPNAGAVFYLRYHIVIDDQGFPYDHSGLAARIDAEKISNIPIPLLSELDVDELTKPITTSVHIKIQNTGTSALVLRRGTSEVIPQGADSPIVNGGETVMYLVNGGPASGYSFMKNTVTAVAFPAGLTDFTAGHLYSLRFDGTTLVLLADRPITIAQALKILPPENITAKSLANGHVSLTWDKVGTETDYVIYRSESGTGNYASVGRSNGTSYTDDGVAIGTTYYYRISSVKNNVESDKSTTVVSARAEFNSLSSPAGLTITGRTANSISLSWQQVPDATGYRVSRSTGSGNSYNSLNTTTGTTYTDVSLTPNATYYYRVTAYNSQAESDAATVSGTTNSGDGTIPLPPAKPAGLVVNGVASGSVSLSWNGVANTDSYDIYRRNTKDSAPAKIGSVTGTSWTDTAGAGAMYYYSVKAVNSSGSSPESDMAFACATSHYSLPTYSPASSPLSLPAGAKHYYRLPVTAGQSYTITWENGSGQNADGHIDCTAWQNDGTQIMYQVNNGYTSPRAFVAISTGYVTVEVYNWSSSTSYNYKIYYN